MAAAMLGIDPQSTELSIRSIVLPYFYRTEFFEGAARGYHDSSRVLIAQMPDGQLLPLGNRFGRRILISWFPPELQTDDLPAYAAVLAALDGDVARLGTAVTTMEDLPSWMRRWATENNVAVPPANVRDLGYGRFEVTTPILADALFLVTAYIGERRFEDGIVKVELLIGSPPG